MAHTDDLSDRLLRLPLWIGVDQALVVSAFVQACRRVRGGG
jgi:hypothetical protein